MVMPALAAALLLLIMMAVLDGRQRERLFASMSMSMDAGSSRAGAMTSVNGSQDALTGLPTRIVLQQRLQIPRHRRAALLVLGIDGFRAINAVYGHAAGDALLCKMAERLGLIARDDDLIVRLHGDEFAILTSVEDPDQAAALARRVLQRMQKPFLLDGGEVHITVSVGAAVEAESRNRRKLLANASLALRNAKDSGRNRHIVFEASMEATGIEIELMIGDLRKAIRDSELFLVYQPKLDLATGSIRSVEALLRWKHPKHGVIPPDQFIPLAENTGMIGEIGAWTLDEAGRQMRQWRNEQVVGWNVAINVSIFQLNSPCFFDTVCDMLERHDLDPCDLTLEVTESNAMRNLELTMEVLCKLASIGVNLSLDDFGVGHSSLSHLKRLPVRELKVDRSFISDIETDPENMAIVSAIVSLAKATDLKVVAEGVETLGQQALLAEIGCDVIQGYLIGRPGPPGDVATIARSYEAKRRTFEESFTA
jgi:diguanylate cyclase (GGDEF)-like protein